MKEKPTTKLCKHCKTEIPAGAKVCPHCRKKQGGVLKWIGIVFVALIVISAIGGGGDKKDSTTQTSSNSDSKSNVVETNTVKEDVTKEEPEEQKEIEYISVTATELSDALSNNAMKAQNDYKDRYLEITGKLGNIDSNGKYIDIDSDNDFDFTIIQCYLQTDEHKNVIMEMSKGDAITIKGYCKDVGEVLGYSINIDEVIK